MIARISTTKINSVIENIKKNGVAEIPGFLTKEKINELESFIHKELEDNPIGYQGRAGLDAFKNTPLYKIELETELLNILVTTHKGMHSKKFSDKKLYKVLRVLKGDGCKNQAYKFHFDAYSITALLPIITPNRKDGNNGDFLFFRKKRRLHQNFLLNVLQKFIVQNIIVKKIVRKKFVSNFLGLKTLKVKPGNLYIFEGFQTYHGNAPCSEETIRATALFHYSDPFSNNWIIRAIERFNIKRHEAGRLNK